MALYIGGVAVDATAAEIDVLDGLDRGSIIYGNASSVTTVLGQGGADEVLTSDGTDIAWAAAGGGGVSGITSDGTDITITSGDLIIGTHGKGIDFSANTDDAGGMTAEILDDYEEGTFTPTYSTTGTDYTTVNYTTQLGVYTKIGRIVHVGICLVTGGPNTLGSASGQLTIAGLPFAAQDIGVADSYFYSYAGSGIWDGGRFTTTNPTGPVCCVQNQSYVVLKYLQYQDDATHAGGAYVPYIANMDNTYLATHTASRNKSVVCLTYHV